MTVPGRGTKVRPGKPIPTLYRGKVVMFSKRGYPLGYCQACCHIQEAGYCTHCGSSVDPFDKNIRWPPAKGWLPSEADELKKGVVNNE